MKEYSLDNIIIYKFDKLEEFDEVLHFVSTRKGGISNDCFSGLNTGFHVGDDNFRVLQNRRMLTEALGIDLMNCTFANQCHTSNVAIVNDSGRGRGALEKETALTNTDALVTNVPNICLGVQVADCVPILLYDPVFRVIASVHAGWKGTVRKIAGETVYKMVYNYGSRPENIIACLGPSNGPCCYEVGNEVVREAGSALGSLKGIIRETGREGRFIFDQWEANVRQLKDSGLKGDNIELPGICTQCNSGMFYSHRKHNGMTGRFMAGIMLKKRRL